MDQFERRAPERWQEFWGENHAELGHPGAAGADLNAVYARWNAELPPSSGSLGKRVLLSLNGVGSGRGPWIGGHDGTEAFVSSLNMWASSTSGGVDHVG
ncbi:hypothetical protein ACIPPR_33855 [Streptomyces nigra]|uniref:hypothetical protein n=1 Tax=Streptomyces nigra TaxID=1827580 RepID=UPI00381B3E74